MKRIHVLSTKLVAAFAALAFALACTVPSLAFAATDATVTFGADLTSDQRLAVTQFFNLTTDDLNNMNVVIVNNANERAYLEGVLPSEVIGDKTYSCAYIQPTDAGGIQVRTANLNYVTSNTLYNALQTAGIENCNLVVTAPFEVSGTGALTGIFMAYESKGIALEEAKKEAATAELVETAQLEQTYGEEVAELISDVKNQVASATANMTDDEIRELIRRLAAQYGIALSDNDIEMILQIARKIQELDFDPAAFSDTLKQINNLLDAAAGAGENAKGVLGAVGDFFSGIWNWILGLFGQAPQIDTSGAEDFFKQFNTDVFQFDNAQ